MRTRSRANKGYPFVCLLFIRRLANMKRSSKTNLSSPRRFIIRFIVDLAECDGSMCGSIDSQWTP